MKNFIFLTLLAMILTLPAFSQQYTRQDSLRGTLSGWRSCYDVYFYDLQVRVDPENRSIKGSNAIFYKVTEDFEHIQIDLFANLTLEKIVFEGKSLVFKREGNATFVQFPGKQKKGEKGKIEVLYSGKPMVAVNAPWDGGFSWAKDKNGNHWIGVSCEGHPGASVWWPNKDHLSDEPDSMRISCEVPGDLMCVSNGNLRKTAKTEGGYNSYEWFVSYPINNYNVTLNIGKYAHFTDAYTSEDGETLSLDYYVLDYNLGKAKKQFEQVKPMLKCYEFYFGKYPFWKDGFALVDTHYLGMEHQGAIAYGNEYKQGYKGFDITYTGLGMLFDYIIIHETGHEYWGNNISCKDHAELWIHESFCTYSEGLYVECLHGKEKAYTYLMGYANSIGNQKPIIGPLGVNSNGSSDMYPKGALMLHTLRNVIDNDKLWFEILKGLNKDFRHQTVDTRQIVDYINKKTGKDFTYFFDLYLRKTETPRLVYKITPASSGKMNLEYKWENKGFVMPLKIMLADKTYKTIYPADQWKKETLALPTKGLILQPKSYYIVTENK